MSNPRALNTAHNFILYLQDASGVEKALGTFSDVVGLVHKVPGLHNVGDVTLKRGVVNSGDLSEWIQSAGSSGTAGGTAGKRNIIVSQLNQANVPLRAWRLANAVPAKYTGPTLAGKSADVAIEELILAVESIEIVPPR
jgi:phage tail-like protein